MHCFQKRKKWELGAWIVENAAALRCKPYAGRRESCPCPGQLRPSGDVGSRAVCPHATTPVD